MSEQHSSLEGAEFLKPQVRGLYEPAGSKSLGDSAERSAKHNAEVAAQVPYFQDWRTAANQIKRYAVANLDRLLVEFERKMAAKGATVLWAENAA
jgi:L-lactate utilization protein LutB